MQDLTMQVVCRLSLVGQCGDHLLHYPILERGCSIKGPIGAVARCKEGTAAWQSFQGSVVLRSDHYRHRCSFLTSCPTFLNLHAYFLL